MNIGLVIPPETYLFSPWKHNYYHTEILRGVIAAASLFECNVNILHKGIYKRWRYIELGSNINLEGLIILAPVLKKKEVDEIKSLRKPLILINSRPRGLNFIDADNKKGALQVVDYLCQMGHRRIAFIGGDINTVNARKRLEGYKAAIKGKARIKDEYIKYGDFSEDSGYHEMLELFNCRQMPSAVFCANDLMALGAIKAIKEKKLSVPRDISIVGFDDLVISEYFDPPLTSVRQPLFHIGKEALITLTGIINKEKKVPQQIEIETRLIKRKSVADIN